MDTWNDGLGKGRKGTKVRMALAVKATKFESMYIDVAKDPRSRCAFCMYFHSSDTSRTDMGTCTKVIGVIDPVGWCKYYERRLNIVKE